MIVNVYYRDEETGSVRAGRPYSYRCSIPNASVGMEVIAPHGQARGPRRDLRDRRPGKPHRRADLAASERDHAGGARRWRIT